MRIYRIGVQALGLPPGMPVILESDNYAVCQDLAEYCTSAQNVAPGAPAGTPATKLCKKVLQGLLKQLAKHLADLAKGGAAARTQAAPCVTVKYTSSNGTVIVSRPHEDVHFPPGLGIQSGRAQTMAQAVLTAGSYPQDSYIVFYPNQCSISTARVEGIKVNCTNDVAAAGSSRHFLIDADFLVSLPHFSDALSALLDPGKISVCSGKVPSHVLGVLAKPLRLKIWWNGPTATDGDRSQEVVVREVYVVYRLPVPLHISFNDQTEAGWPGMSISRMSTRPTADTFVDASCFCHGHPGHGYASHPYWSDSTMFLSLPLQRPA